MAAGARVDRRDVEYKEQYSKHTNRQDQTDNDRDQLTSFVVCSECHVRHQSKAEDKAEGKADEMGVVVDHG